MTDYDQYLIAGEYDIPYPFPKPIRVHRHSYLDDIREAYELHQRRAIIKIRMKSKRIQRIFGWIWHFITFPFIWIWNNIRDWRTAIIFVIVFLVVSSEVWVPYMLAFIAWNNEPFRISALSVATTCWLFWLGPGTPFLVIVVGLTMLVKSIINKIGGKHK